MCEPVNLRKYFGFGKAISCHQDFGVFITFEDYFYFFLFCLVVVFSVFVSPAKQKRDICIAFPASSLSSSSSSAAA